MGYKLKHNPDKCDGCQKCVEACRQAHKGVSNNAIFELNGKFYYFVCVQCVKPACMNACPVGAFEKVEGVVKLYVDRCVGCLNCAEACPFGVPRFNPFTGVITKCDLCIDRVKAGEQPYCVSACPNKALQLLKMEPKAKPKPKAKPQAQAKGQAQTKPQQQAKEEASKQ